MSYGRTKSEDELDPAVVEALAQQLGLNLSSEEAAALTPALVNQIAAMEVITRFDLQEVVPATVFSVGARWDD